MARNRLTVFDTTLRDGEQAPGFSMRIHEKVRLARQLDALGVDIIEAGFPIASEADAEAVKAVAAAVRRPVIAGLSRACAGDIDKAGWALRGAARARIHTFIATSDLHLERKLNMTREACLAAATGAVVQARRYTDDVQFSAEDATRSDPDFLCRVVEAVIAAGATTINLPDTVGYSTPDEIAEFFTAVIGRVPNADKAVFSTHCHNDLGLAVANSLAAVGAGVRQVECTINGIGERAGNASLEEIAMVLRVRQDRHPYQTGLDTRALYATSQMLTELTGQAVQSNKAVVGRNAFAHEAGIHQDGILKDRRTYEIMRPEDVGLTRSHLVLGKHSGRAALRDRIKELGFELSDAEIARVFEDFKSLADKKKELFDGDIEALVLKAEFGESGPWHLESLHAVSDSAGAAMARVGLRHSDGRLLSQESTGDGPVDAAFKAIEAATGIAVTLRKFEVRSVSMGEDAQGEAVVTAEHNGRAYRGSSVTTDIVESGVRAFLEVVNRIESTRATTARRTPEPA